MHFKDEREYKLGTKNIGLGGGETAFNFPHITIMDPDKLDSLNLSNVLLI